jgi:hypothetical protein
MNSPDQNITADVRKGSVSVAVFHLSVGNSRYRLPVEPALIFLALCGVDGLCARLRREG